MSAEDDHTPDCAGHCIHVGFMWRDFKRMERAFFFCFAGIIALLGKQAWDTMSSHIRDSGTITHEGERLAPDRVARSEEPSR